MEGDFIKINDWLLPLSWLYGLGVKIRNWCFDVGILKQHSFTTPVISVGNLTVGGCGKTPHVEYLISLLRKKSHVSVLSRGYKRKTRGYVLADENTTMPEIGDEPFQMLQKFSGINIAVCADRVKGIRRLLSDEATSDTDVILLDDAYQHRYVKPGLNILLVDYHRLIIYDKLLPAGRLREPQSGKERADIVIVTKCPPELRPMDYRVLTKAMALRPYQKLYFTCVAYDSLRAMSDGNTRPLSSIMPDEQVLLIAGIASPEQILSDLSVYSHNIQALTYSDHHQFTRSDISKINQRFAEMKGPKIAIITEKDATRLRHVEGLDPEVFNHLYVLPIHVEFKLDHKENFDERILSYVMKNSKHSVLHSNKKKNK